MEKKNTSTPVSHVKKNGKALDVLENARPKPNARKPKPVKMDKSDLDKLKVEVINTGTFMFPEETIVPEPEKYKCSCCGLSKKFDSFFVSYSVLNKDRAMMSACKDCIDVLWKSYLIKYYGDISRTLYYFCMLVDVPYYKNVLEEVNITEGESTKFFKRYMEKVISFGKQNNALTFLDGQLLWDGTNEKDPDFFEYDAEAIDYVPTLKDVKMWGRLPPQDIYYLKNELEDWKQKTEISDKSMEEIVKQICYKQLKIFRLNEVDGNTSNEIKDLNSLMTSAKLKPIQNKTIGSEENTLGAWIKRFENERPIPEPDPEFADVDGIWKKIRIWFLGHFSKVYNYENEFSREYEQEMSKYRVDSSKEIYETKWATHEMGKELFKND